MARRRGSHVQLRKFDGDRKVTFPVPVHAGKTLKPGTLKGIVRSAELSIEDLLEILG